jgi:ornithine carbamoyltransferase
MADIFTVREHRGHLDNLKIAFVGDGNNIVHSWLRLSCRLPFTFACACPEFYMPDEKTIKRAVDAGISQIEIVHDPRQAVKDADVVYTDVWASMNKKQEMEERKIRFQGYQVTPELMSLAKKDAIFLHCLPAYRGMEVSDAVMDAPYSLVFTQSENRMHIQNAIMLKLAGKA